MRPALRAPLLGFGLGAVAGGFEAAVVGTLNKLALGPIDLLRLGPFAVVGEGLLAAAIAVPVGILVELVTRSWEDWRRHALGMFLTASLLGAAYAWPAARDLFEQGRKVPAVAFVVVPLGLGGVVWMNARYWLRREDIGEERRLGWGFWSLAIGLGLATAGVAAAAVRASSVGGGTHPMPSVLIVTVDTLRRDHVSAYGSSPVPTPAMDALIERGVRFDDAVTPLPETAPAHAALLTGRHPVRTGVLSNGHSLPRRYPTLPEVLGDQGWATAAFVSAWSLDSRTGLDQGFEVYDDDFSVSLLRGTRELLAVKWALAALWALGDPGDWPGLLERPAPATYARALDWIGRHRDRPFLCLVHTFEPHAPYEPHGLPGFEDNGAPGTPSVGHRALLADPDHAWTEEERRRLRRLYQEEVAYADLELGRFLDEVDALEIDRPLLVVFAADHGEMLGEHGVDFHHHGLWEEVIRIPFAVVPPNPGPDRLRVIDAQVRLMDVPATVLGLLSLGQMPHGEGESLVPYLRRIAYDDVTTLLVGRTGRSTERGQLVGYRAGSVKYVRDVDSGRESLYDVDADPHEERDLAPANAETVARARARVDAETRGLAEAPDGRADGALRALGYVE